MSSMSVGSVPAGARPGGAAGAVGVGVPVGVPIGVPGARMGWGPVAGGAGRPGGGAITGGDT
eukprot:11240022-Alexandrium_andersonii.AAC.1